MSNGMHRGKIALVTGANKGIGLETARQLGQLGMTVLLGARDLAKGERAAEQLRAEGMDAHAIKLDMAQEADHAAAARAIEAQHGRLDVLVNNAGILLENKDGNITSTLPMRILRETMETNFFSVVALTQTLMPLLRRSEGARIVNLSSDLGSLADQADPKSSIYEVKMFAYDTSKTALNAFTIHLAHELRDTPIKVNSAHPGWVKTDMGSQFAPMELVDGAKTSVMLATLPADGPTGGYFHLGKPLRW